MNKNKTNQEKVDRLNSHTDNIIKVAFGISQTTHSDDLPQPNHFLPDDAYIFRCDCGNIEYYLTPDGPVCKGCGALANDWVDI